MSSADEHAAAIEGMNESEVSGRVIYVSESLAKDKVAANKQKYKANQRQSKYVVDENIMQAIVLSANHVYLAHTK